MSPTSRTLKLLREQGFFAEVVERRVPYKNITHDYAGCCDIIALRGRQTFCVQATSGSNISARVKKIQASPNYPLLKKAGWSVAVIGWSKRSVVKKDGKKGKAKRWQPRTVEL